MSAKTESKTTATTSTTGHVWDDDLREYTNPLPNWWIWGFYLTFIFTLVYWMMYPAWPIGTSFTKGIPGLNTVSYVATSPDGKKTEKTTHWSTRALLMHEMNEHQAKQNQWLQKIAAMPPEQIAKDPELMQFVNSAGHSLFLDNCAACHQQGGQGKLGLAPNLTDDYWQYGGTYEKIHETITSGRNGMMPSFAGTLTEPEITDVSNYVLQLSGYPHDDASAKRGDEVFHGNKGICFSCHGADAKGNPDIGSANLTDKIWTLAKVEPNADQAHNLAAVSDFVSGKVSRGVMPAWSGRLSPEQIKLLTVYVHDSLGAGK